MIPSFSKLFSWLQKVLPEKNSFLFKAKNNWMYSIWITNLFSERSSIGTKYAKMRKRANAKAQKHENAKTQKPRKRRKRENAENTKTQKTRKRRKRENTKTRKHETRKASKETLKTIKLAIEDARRCKTQTKENTKTRKCENGALVFSFSCFLVLVAASFWPRRGFYVLSNFAADVNSYQTT